MHIYRVHIEMSNGPGRSLQAPPCPALEPPALVYWHSIQTSAVKQDRGVFLEPSCLEYAPSYWGQAPVREAWNPVEGLAGLHHSAFQQLCLRNL
eukprot:1780036-Amphidinium_carterae.2